MWRVQGYIFDLSFFFTWSGGGGGGGPRKEVENERQEKGKREKERRPSGPGGYKEVRGGEAGGGGPGRDGRGKTGDAGPEAHTQREEEGKRARWEEEARETELRRTFYASYVAHAYTRARARAPHDARGARAHTRFEHTGTEAF